MTNNQIQEWIAHADREWDCDRDMLEWWRTFADQVAANEREACAKTCEEWLHGQWHNQGVIAAAMIRRRGE